MQAGFVVSPSDKVPRVELICNFVQPQFINTHFAARRYKKVSEAVRDKIIRSVQNGWKIIAVADKYNVNYSTAKSIVQNHKKQKLRRLRWQCKPQEQSNEMQCRHSSTGECEMLHEE